jgi:hypothetical protein
MKVAGREITLDARPDRLDIRDLPYRPPVESLAPVFPSNPDVKKLLPGYIKAGMVLDQGEEGACTGFGLACTINYLLWARSGFQMKRADKVSPRMLYHLARFYDEWPGEDYEGSSCRGALKGWHRHGVCRETLWPYNDPKGGIGFVRPTDGWDFDALSRPLGVYYRIDRKSVVDIQAAIYQTGAVYVSASVHGGWDVVKSARRELTHDTLPTIAFGPKSKIGGGHAFALVGYNERGFVVQNSWGLAWGASGFAVMTYEDWVENGTDAWVVSIGAPVSSGVRGSARAAASASPRHFVSRPAGAAGADRSTWLGVQRDTLGGRPGVWSEDEAYAHSLVTGNDGCVINRLLHVKNETDNAHWVCCEQPAAWFAKQGARKPWRVAIYAHGGLNAESESIERIRILGPAFKDNGIYPVFTTWKSGWLETLGNILSDGAKSVFGGAPPARGLGDAIIEATDRALEVIVRNLLVKSMWSEMKENVARGANPGRGIDMLAQRIAGLAKCAADAGAPFEVHLVGHSAGSFVCGRLLTELRTQAVNVESCTLFAPACDIGFALEHFRPAVENKQLARDKLRIRVLSDALELDDSVGPYRKSLLYLVSRALERRHKTPLLGLAAAFDGACASDEHWHRDTVAQVREWQSFFWQGKAPRGFAKNANPPAGKTLRVLTERQVSVGPRKIKSSHGCFDNAVEIITDTVKSITGAAPKQAITNLDF